MTQPKYAPIRSADEVRPTARLAPARPWRATRPADYRPGPWVSGRRVGAPGPDQGYALRLARMFIDRLVLADGEHEDDVIEGAVAIAMRRASLIGRAPVATDIEVALALFGYLEAASPELVAFRRPLFAGAGHHYSDQRALAHLVPAETLVAGVDAVRSDPASWRAAIAVSAS